MSASHKNARLEFHPEPHSKIGGLLKETVFGFNDGVVSTFALIAGLTGGLVDNKTVLLAALATLAAGAFSMGLGTYIGSKTEKEHYEGERKRELWEMEHVPELEIQEIRDIYAAKGFKGELLEKIVAHITKNDKLWLETMMREELGFAEAPPKPGLNGIIMAASFTGGSFIATLPYIFASLLPSAWLCEPAQCVESVKVFGIGMLFFLSLVFSGAGLFIIGAAKTRFTKQNPVVSAMETLGIGALAAGGAYGIGLLFG